MSSIAHLKGKTFKGKGNNTKQPAYAELEELKRRLDESDHKELPRYQERNNKTDEEMVQIHAERAAWTKRVREIESELGI